MLAYIPANLFRVKDWWSSKAALLLCLVYLYSGWFVIPFNQFVLLLFLSLTTISGFAATGYMCNDLFDIEKDILAGKRNFLAGKRPATIVGLFVLSFTMLLLPWCFLPYTYWSILLIVAELLLLLVYSVKPVRLKERGLAGVIVDALYAHVVPTALSLYTFGLAAHKRPGVVLVVLLLLWQLFSGVRNILLHMADDYENDRNTNVNNLTHTINAEVFNKWLVFNIIAELVLCSTMLLLLVPVNTGFGICALLVWVFMGKGMYQILQATPVVFFKGKARYFPNTVFEQWLPIALLGVGAAINVGYAFVGVVHLLVFNVNAYIRGWHIAGPTIKGILFFVYHFVVYRIVIPLKIIVSIVVNFTIYRIFLLFKVDLEKEKLSAWQYFKKLRSNNNVS